MKQARFTASARREFLAETAYYQEIQPALGERFAKAIENAAELALMFPDAGIPSLPAPAASSSRDFRFP